MTFREFLFLLSGEMESDFKYGLVYAAAMESFSQRDLSLPEANPEWRSVSLPRLRKDCNPGS